MSDTPRTDEQAFITYIAGEGESVVDADFARILERDYNRVVKEQREAFECDRKALLEFRGVVIISIVLAGHLYVTDSENISPLTYIFVGVWTIILGTYYYRQFTQYGSKVWDSLSASITDDMP